MGKRVTIQDIADRLGLSRNTVSKALNNVAGLSDSTRELILKTAMEMGYKQFAFIGAVQDLKPKDTTAQAVKGPNEIALLTTAFIDRSHFASLTLDALHFELSQRGYVLNTHRVNRDQLAAHELPITLRLENTTAILCIEMFDRNYCNFICSLGVPTLFFDGPPRVHGFNLESDQILMDNTTSVMRLVDDMARRGVKRIGFVGDWTHCQSFLERYLAFRNGMSFAGLPIDERYCIKHNKVASIGSSIAALDELPELFICANDFVLIDALRSLRKQGYDVPRDVLLAGFDDSSESRSWMPSFTTIHIHTQAMAYNAMELLMSRIQEPTLEYRRMYVQTDLIYRQSTQRTEGEQ
jgi:LacI family transcriptional regulator